MEFFNWSALGTCAGALAATLAVTEITKSIPVIKSIPTQIWSYIVAAVILMCATLFNGDFSGANVALVFVNAAVVSLAANGSYEAIAHLAPEEEYKDE